MQHLHDSVQYFEMMKEIPIMVYGSHINDSLRHHQLHPVQVNMVQQLQAVVENQNHFGKSVSAEMVVVRKV